MRIVIAYHPVDSLAKVKLKTFLRPLELDIWDESQLKAGDYTKEEIEKKFSQADCVLFLMSADSLADENLLRLVSTLHFNKTARIVPIILRDCLWEDSAFGSLLPLPADKRPLLSDSLENADARLGSTAREIKQLLTGAQQSTADLPPLSKSASRKLPANPYIGLTWFTHHDAPVFFGRNRDIKEVIDLIGKREVPVLALYGASGVGKSSLLEAGIRPRLEEQYFITYQRREKSLGYAELLQRELNLPSPDHRSRLVILDQLEEMFTDENPAIPDEKERFFHLLNKCLDTHPDWFFILGFRKEYFTDLKKRVYDNDLEWHTFSVEPLDRNSILEAITGVTLVSRLREKYGLVIDENLPYTIAADILKDKAAHTAPLLQILLRKMWDAVAADERNRRFSPELYAQFQVSSLDALLTSQLDVLKTDFREALQSGLALDLLHFFTTESQTAAQWTDAEVMDVYEHIPDILHLKEALKKVYLLAEAEDKHYTRLAHDALARLVAHHYERSELVGPKATRLLRYATEMKSTLTREGVFEIFGSRGWRRKFTDDEENTYRNSLREHYQSIAKLLIAENLIEPALLVLRTTLALDPANQKELGILDDKEKQLLSARSELNKGIISYLDYQQKRTLAKTALLRWINTIGREEKIKAFNELLESFFEESLEICGTRALAFAERLGNKEIIDDVNDLYAQQVEISDDERNSIIFGDEAWLLKSRTIANFAAILERMASELQDAGQPGLMTTFLAGQLNERFFDDETASFSKKLTTALHQNPSSQTVQHLFRWAALIHQARWMQLRALLSNSEALIIRNRLQKALFYLLEKMQVLSWDEVLELNGPLTYEGWQNLWETERPDHEIFVEDLLRSIGANKLWKATLCLDKHFQAAQKTEELHDLHRLTKKYLENRLEWYLLSVTQKDFVLPFNRFVQSLSDLAINYLSVGHPENHRPLGPEVYHDIFKRILNDQLIDINETIQATHDLEESRNFHLFFCRIAHNVMLLEQGLIDIDNYFIGHNRIIYNILDFCRHKRIITLTPDDFLKARNYPRPEYRADEWPNTVQDAAHLADDLQLDEAFALLTNGLCHPGQTEYLQDFAIVYARHQHTSNLDSKGFIFSSDKLRLNRGIRIALLNLCKNLAPQLQLSQTDNQDDTTLHFDENQEQKSVEQLISEGNTDHALIALLRLAEAQEESMLVGSILQLKSRWSYLRQSWEGGTQSFNEYSIAERRVVLAALDYYQQLKKH